MCFGHLNDHMYIFILNHNVAASEQCLMDFALHLVHAFCCEARSPPMLFPEGRWLPTWLQSEKDCHLPSSCWIYDILCYTETSPCPYLFLFLPQVIFSNPKVLLLTIFCLHCVGDPIGEQSYYDFSILKCTSPPHFNISVIECYLPINGTQGLNGSIFPLRDT